MRKKKLIIPLLAILVLSGMFAIANNYHWFAWNADSELPGAREELRRLYTAYGKTDSSFYVTGMIRLYDKENKDALKEETSFVYSQQGKQGYSRIGPIQTFFADTLVIQLDTLNKYLIVSKLDNMPVDFSVQAGLPFEKYMEDTAEFKIHATVSEKNKKRALTITNELTPEIKSTAIFYDPATYTIHRTEIDWWKEPNLDDRKEDLVKIWHTVTEFSYSQNPGISARDQIKKIITWIDNRIVPGAAYQAYEFRVTF